MIINDETLKIHAAVERDIAYIKSYCNGLASDAWFGAKRVGYYDIWLSGDEDRDRVFCMSFEALSNTLTQYAMYWDSGWSLHGTSCNDTLARMRCAKSLDQTVDDTDAELFSFLGINVSEEG